MCNTSNEYINIKSGEVLDKDIVSQLKGNALLKNAPCLWIEWDFEKNDELGLDIWKVTKGSNKKAWWICSKCESEYYSFIGKRVDGKGCGFCSGKHINHTNSLSTLNPQLASQWHPTKNGILTPHDVTCNNNKKAWWSGTCGHEWEATTSSRTIGSGCPYCNGYMTLKGFNDMWTTNPELASWLADSEDGYKYMQSVSTKVNWRCKNCGNIKRNKTINNVNRQGICCEICRDYVSFSEKLIYNILKCLDIEFSHDLGREWSNRKRYDFYIHSMNVIIEAHGEQHYVQTSRKGARSLAEEQANDRYKYEMATKNGIKPENYIVIDCRYSDFKYIKNNILNSRLAELFDMSNIDWNDIVVKSSSSLFVEVFRLTSEGFSRKEVHEITGISISRIYNAVQRYNKLKEEY